MKIQTHLITESQAKELIDFFNDNDIKAKALGGIKKEIIKKVKEEKVPIKLGYKIKFRASKIATKKLKEMRIVCYPV